MSLVLRVNQLTMLHTGVHTGLLTVASLVTHSKASVVILQASNSESQNKTVAPRCRTKGAYLVAWLSSSISLVHVHRPRKPSAHSMAQ